MSLQVPPGAQLTYSGTWPHTEYVGFGTVDQLVGDVGSAIQPFGLVIRSYSSSGGLAPLLGTSFNVTLQIQNQNQIAFGDVEDVRKIVNDAVTNLVGAPTASSVPYCTGCGSADGSTGQAPPATQPGATHVCGDPSWGFFDDPAQYLTCASQKGFMSLGLIFVGLIAGVILLVTAKHEV